MLLFNHFIAALVALLLVGFSVLAVPTKGTPVTDPLLGHIYQARASQTIPKSGPRVCAYLMANNPWSIWEIQNAGYHPVVVLSSRLENGCVRVAQLTSNSKPGPPENPFPTSLANRYGIEKGYVVLQWLTIDPIHLEHLHDYSRLKNHVVTGSDLAMLQEDTASQKSPNLARPK